MTKNVTAIYGPLGRPFHLPLACETITRTLTQSIWRNEYDHAQLPPVQSVIDIGSGWGAFLVWARLRFGTGIQIRGYDPHAAACELARKNDPQAHVVVAAVTSNANARFKADADWGRCSTGDEGESVPIIHPKDLPPCDLLKCDAEGNEADVLQGYAHWAGLKAIIYEWHTEALRSQCREIVASKGMRLLEEREGPYGPVLGVAIWTTQQAPQ